MDIPEKRPRGRPKGSTKPKKRGRRGAPPERLDLKLDPKVNLHPAVRPLEKALTKKTVADYVLSGKRPAEVAELMDVSLTTVYNAMKEMENELSSETQTLAERLRYINIARIERMMAVFFERAIEGDQRAGEFVNKMIDLEEKLVDKTQPKTEDSHTAINIENIELTITAGNPMFQIAQKHMEQDWLGLIDTPLEMLYENPTDLPQLSDKNGERISAMEELYGEYVERPSTDDDD